MINTKEELAKLKAGEKISLMYDECIKIMFTARERLEPLTLLVSKILGVKYEDIEGNVEILPTRIPKRQLGKKKLDRDIVVSVKSLNTYLVLEFNINPRDYRAVINRNILYYNEVHGSNLNVSDGYSNISTTILVNFNTFFVDKKNRLLYDYYPYQNDYGNHLTDLQKVLNINIKECYNIYCSGKEVKFSKQNERDLFYFCAAMVTKKIDEFNDCINKIHVKKAVKDIIKEVSEEMSKPRELIIPHYDFLMDEELLKKGIRDEIYEEMKAKIIKKIEAKSRKVGRERGLAEGRAENQKDMIINFFKNGASLNLICASTGLAEDNVLKIIEDDTKK